MSSLTSARGRAALPLAHAPWRASSPGLVVTITGAGLAAGAVAVLTPSPLYVVAALLATAGFVFALAFPMTALAAGLVAIPFDAFLGGLPAGQVTLLVTALAVAVRWLQDRPLRITPSVTAAGMLLLVVATASGLLFAPHPTYPLKQLVHWGSFLVLFQAVVNDGDPRTARKLMGAVALSGALVGLTAVLGIGANAVDPAGTGRAVANFGSPNGLGIFLVLALPAQAAFALRGRPLVRLAAAAGVVVSGYAVLLTSSRSALLGAVAALVVLGLWSAFRRVAVVSLVALVVLVLAGGGPLAASGTVDRLAARLTNTSKTAATDPRATVYKVAPEMIADHPLFGIGALEFATYSTRYGLPISGGVTTHAHDITLTVAIELGLLGVIGLALTAGSVAVAIRRGLRTASGPDRALLFACAAALTALTVEGLIDYPLSNSNIAVVIFTIAACAVLLAQRAPAVPPPPGPPARPTTPQPTWGAA